jgi:glucose/arabinose dehydrogenase
MKRIVLFALLVAPAAAAQDQTKPRPAVSKATAKKKTSAPKSTEAAAKPAPPPTAQPLTIPADAAANPDGTYSYTDKSGKQWTYSKTPFGISRIQNAGSATAGSAPAPKEQLVTATDRGDTVKFAKQTPFGTSTWEKKKTEMTDEERAIFQSQHPDNQQ